MEPPNHSRGRRAVAEWLLIVAVFFVLAGEHPPDVNEAHYLAKARHYWTKQGRIDDFFLNSQDAHTVFYWSCGWLTKWLSLPATAWVGRLITWGLLAWAWMRLAAALAPSYGAAKRFGLPVLTAALFGVGMKNLPMAGEWVVGGFEAKGIAYVFVLLAVESIVAGRWRMVWVFVGLASSFHVLVGGWSGVAAACAWLLSPNRPRLATQIPFVLIGVALSLPGLAPAVLLSLGADRATAAEANRIYVFDRLPHHLVFHEFAIPKIARFAAATAAWGALAWVVRGDERLRRLSLFVGGALLIAAVGIAIDLATLRQPESGAGLLRFYFFRLSDIAVPLGLACMLPAAVERLRRGAGWRIVTGNFAYGACLIVALVGVSVEFFTRRAYPIPPAERLLMARQSLTPEQAKEKHQAWLAACQWIRRHSPPEARFITPQFQQSFKWRAERSEVVCWKDVPQDAASIVAWRRRIDDIFPPPVLRWGLFAHRDSALVQLGRKYDAQFVIIDGAQGRRRTRLKKVYPATGDENAYYEIYRLSPASLRSALPQAASAGG